MRITYIVTPAPGPTTASIPPHLAASGSPHPRDRWPATFHRLPRQRHPGERAIDRAELSPEPIPDSDQLHASTTARPTDANSYWVAIVLGRGSPSRPRRYSTVSKKATKSRHLRLLRPSERAL